MSEKFAGKMTSACHPSQPLGNTNKPLELYLFIDPLCPECWGLEPVIKKLTIEYGRFFTLRHILSGTWATWSARKGTKPEAMAKAWEWAACRTGMSCDGSVWLENRISSPFAPSLAIKAAEMQGKRAGLRFLRKLQEQLFLEKQNVADLSVLAECAVEAGLDVDEFLRDMHSPGAAKAFQCDLKITSEMDVDEIPTLVLFNENIEDEGIKISGCYPYDIYVELIAEMLGFHPEPSSPPPLESFLSHFKFVATQEVAVVYNWTIQEAETEMKKLQLKQKVERVPVKHGTFWRYIDDARP
ncbi:ClpXP adapter protein SpxH [Geobacillus thermoleovorans]|uniref:ClpXP adapter protein SpxH n=1 Tax=Geobacillus kaustophilus TaxID=1462 RepID=A0A0D8BRA2_GEOKU|nr:ClpXP adapter protein SpxH [Geobacillus kaustophilus]KJE26681.1 DSBA-like thioredoxin domain protein [Geobacillus kaustophilus]